MYILYIQNHLFLGTFLTCVMIKKRKIIYENIFLRRRKAKKLRIF